MLTFIKSLFQSLLIMLTRPPSPQPAPAGAPRDVVTTLAQLIESRTIALGPIPGTGGVIHKVTSEQATPLATIIVAAAIANKLRLSLLQALLDGESRDDADAIDPNDQLAKRGETASQAALHEDVGIAQEDVTTALGDPQFSNMTTDQIITRLKDPTYGVNFAAATLAQNLARAKEDFAQSPALAKNVPNGDPDVLGCQAYNSGYNGALEIAAESGASGNWKYGVGVVAKAAGWAALLDG